MSPTLDGFRRLGTSGLRVSPLSLGTMTFGTEWGWGTAKDDCRRIFDAYVEAGGNFIDTANFYTGGTSETFVGEFLAGRRDTLVVATKYALAMRPGDPNSGGTHRKNLMQSIDASLARLRTDYVDILWLHAWDDTVPVEEVMRGLDDVVHAGKALYAGVSNAPAWIVARANTLAEARGWAPFAGAQMQYSLAERSVEREIMPMCGGLGIGVVAWSPLAGGVLTGKYARAEAGSKSALDESLRMESNRRRANERNLAIIVVIEAIAKETGRSPAQVAIRWAMQKPGVASVIIGARTPAQLDDNLQAATFDLSADQVQRLDAASAIEMGYPHDYLRSGSVTRFLYGGAKID
ncbi:MAG TPA: aldo/keto reductase [Candidatus Krumholzibacteria bacterium]|nr:aldo/keto reductase [Candidatus Krumholzibacteria bacterium]